MDATLTNLTSLDLEDLGSEENDDINYFDFLTNLKKLRLCDDDSTIPESCRFKFKRMSQLESLCLGFDYEDRLCEEFFVGLELLTELKIATIFLRCDLPQKSNKAFKCLRNLRKLTLHGYKIDDTDFLDNFPNLTCLRLEWITICKIKFSEHRNLEKLEMIYCDLVSTLPGDVFMVLRNLKELHLCGIKGNSLTNANAFNGLGNLIEFRFWSSIIQSRTIEFDINILNKMPKLKRIVLDRRIRKSMDLDLVRTRFPNLKFISFFKNCKI